jgi:D-psicose/D-tagatose/L-ribulose 3-epimerase
MRISFSNIAWDPPEDQQVAGLLARYEVDAVDVAPGKYFANPAGTDGSEVEAVRHWWADRGIEITGMQALLFGVAGLNLFGPAGVQDRMLRHLEAVCRIGSGLGAGCLVFGSPKNRDRSGLDDEQTRRVAVDFFRRLGRVAEVHGVTICLEPNPPRYGANFMTDTTETAAVVREVDNPAVRMQFDTGALSINDEDPAAVLRECAGLVGHIHISEPDLVPVGDGETDHHRVAQALLAALPGHIAAIEMRATGSEPHLASMERALRAATGHYRPAA